MQILEARKKEISDGYMAYLLTQETCLERSGDLGFDEVMFGVYLPGRYSLVFIDEGHQLELSFWYKCRSDRVEYAQNFDLSLGRLGKPATFHFSE